jgi:murein DD-endopeptidase MepM/ murein hydrolase activator NlpD
LRFGALAAVAVGAAACSSEAVRLSENPNASPYAAAPASPMVAQPAPAGRIERQPLPQYQQYQPPPPPPPAATSEVTGTVPVHTGGHWDWQGGTPVVVAQGETISAIAHRHNVPAHEILRANGLTASATLQAGQRLVIPRYVADGGSAKLAHAALPRHPAPSAAAAAPATPGEHVVASGETLSSIAHKHRITIRELAAANSMTPETPLKVGMKLTVPTRAGAGTKTATLNTAPPTTVVTAKPATLQSVKSAEQPAASARIAAPAAEATADDPGPAAAGMPSFRWPLRGRVTTNFGAKTAGGTSDGIDLAVPEGTAVRAADDGVVAYAGNELKGYGNLVLIRHANGFVTAYANASEISVKRNDQVHRGQVIAKSGQTGTAATPQLHFEIRKNSAPVDPMQYLPSDKTASAPL